MLLIYVIAARANNGRFQDKRYNSATVPKRFERKLKLKVSNEKKIRYKVFFFFLLLVVNCDTVKWDFDGK